MTAYDNTDGSLQGIPVYFPFELIGTGHVVGYTIGV